MIGGGAVLAATHGSAPRIRIATTAPLTIVGTGYAAHARVTVVARTDRARRSVSVRTGAAGGFRARFSVLFAVDPCHGSLVVTARGSNGEAATVKRPCRTGDPAVP